MVEHPLDDFCRTHPVGKLIAQVLNSVNVLTTPPEGRPWKPLVREELPKNVIRLTQHIGEPNTSSNGGGDGLAS